MGLIVFVLGQSGSGKTFSIRNLPPNETGIFSVRKGTLPFPEGKDFKICKQANYGIINKVLAGAKQKRYVIDDSQFLMVNEFMDKANETGYQKYTNIGKNFNDLLEAISYRTPDDTVVYLLHHTEVDVNGNQQAKTVGKMLNSYMTPEACADIVLYAGTDGTEHYFVTQSDGTTTAKSPYGMFDSVRIPNDLKLVDDRIRAYYGWTADAK